MSLKKKILIVLGLGVLAFLKGFLFPTGFQAKVLETRDVALGNALPAPAGAEYLGQQIIAINGSASPMTIYKTRMSPNQVLQYYKLRAGQNGWQDKCRPDSLKALLGLNKSTRKVKPGSLSLGGFKKGGKVFLVGAFSKTTGTSYLATMEIAGTVNGLAKARPTASLSPLLAEKYFKRIFSEQQTIGTKQAFAVVYQGKGSREAVKSMLMDNMKAKGWACAAMQAKDGNYLIKCGNAGIDGQASVSKDKKGVPVIVMWGMNK